LRATLRIDLLTPRGEGSRGTILRSLQAPHRTRQQRPPVDLYRRLGRDYRLAAGRVNGKIAAKEKSSGKSRRGKIGKSSKTAWVCNGRACFDARLAYVEIGGRASALHRGTWETRARPQLFATLGRVVAGDWGGGVRGRGAWRVARRGRFSKSAPVSVKGARCIVPRQEKSARDVFGRGPRRRRRAKTDHRGYSRSEHEETQTAERTAHRSLTLEDADRKIT
jgi:hypothetical protein